MYRSLLWETLTCMHLVYCHFPSGVQVLNCSRNWYSLERNFQILSMKFCMLSMHRSGGQLGNQNTTWFLWLNVGCTLRESNWRTEGRDSCRLCGYSKLVFYFSDVLDKCLSGLIHFSYKVWNRRAQGIIGDSSG